MRFHSRTSRFCLRLSAALLLAAAGGCSATVDAPSAETEDEIVGLTDLVTIEAALGLEKQTAAARVNPAALGSGACYKALVVNAPEGAFKFRQYQNGASFFPTSGSGWG